MVDVIPTIFQEPKDTRSALKSSLLIVSEVGMACVSPCKAQDDLAERTGGSALFLLLII